MQNDPIISVIIPCYNVDKRLLLRCVKSLMIQTFADFEILIINDGSMEEYTSCFIEIESIDRRIRVLYKENGGVSSARNFGVKLSKGKYIAFVDADDFVASQYLEQAYSVCKKTNCDYVIGSTMVFPENKTNEKNDNEQDIINNKIEEFRRYNQNNIVELSPHLVSSRRIIHFSNGGHINRGPVARLIKKEIVKKICFPVGIVIGEDVIWNQRALKECKLVVVVKNIWYYYVTNSNSAVNKYRPDAVKIVSDQIDGLSRVLDLNKDELYTAYIERLFSETRGEVCICNLTNKNNKDTFYSKWKSFNSLKKQNPWNQIDVRYFKLATVKDKILFLMFKMNLYFPAAFIRDRLVKKTN